jgi:hypothetical protein
VAIYDGSVLTNALRLGYGPDNVEVRYVLSATWDPSKDYALTGDWEKEADGADNHLGFHVVLSEVSTNGWLQDVKTLHVDPGNPPVGTTNRFSLLVTATDLLSAGVNPSNQIGMAFLHSEDANLENEVNGWSPDNDRFLVDNLVLSETAAVPEPYVVYSRKKGVGNASGNKPLQKARVEALHAAWYYSWSMDRNTNMAEAIEYVPMRHTKWWPPLGDLARCGTFTNMLTWNEPYKFDGSDPTPEEAVTGGQYQDIVDAALRYGAPGSRIGSPTFQGTNDAWQLEFMPLAAAEGLQIDFVTCHRYPNPNQLANALRNDCDALWAVYGKPVWVTEFNGADWSDTGNWTMVDTYTSLIELLYYFERAPHVERYAIFPWDATWPAGAPSPIFEIDIVDGVTNTTSTLTPLGKLYAEYRSADIDGPYPYTWYHLHNKGSKQRLHDNAGTPATADIYTEGDAVEFQLVYADGSDFFMVNRASGERLGYDGSALFWASSAVTDSRVQWTLADSEDGWDHLNHAGTGQRLRGNPLGMVAAGTTGTAVQWSFVRVEMTPYDAWALGYGLIGPAAAATHDGDWDGLANLYEFGLGGNPTNGSDTGHPPRWSRNAGDMTYVYPRRLDSGLTYWLETSTNLVANDWTNSGYVELPETGTRGTDFETVTNTVPVTTSEGFLRLRIR